MRFLLLSSSLLVALLGLSGCAGPDGTDDRVCPAVNTTARVASIDGTTVRVQVLSPTYHVAVLHTDGADFHYYAGSLDACYPEKRSSLREGQEIEVQVDGWEKSEPPQAHVGAIVIRG